MFGGNSEGDVGRFQMAGQMFDPNDTAYVLTTLFPLCLFYLYHKEGLLKLALAGVAVTCAIAVILLTGSRGGILGLGAALLILLTTRIGGLTKGHKIAFLIGVLGVLYAFYDELDVARYMTLADISSDYNISADGGRFQIWAGAFQMVADRPLLGVGVECAPFALYLIREASGASYLRYQHTHNAFLQIVSETGLLGFGVFLSMIGKSTGIFMRMSARGVPDIGEIRALGGFMLVGFVGHLVSAFFLSQAYSVYFALYFGLATVLRKLGANATIVGGVPEDGTRARAMVDSGV